MTNQVTSSVEPLSLNYAVSHIQFQEKYYKPETDLVTSDITRAFLSKEGVNFIRRESIVVALLKNLGFYHSAQVVRDVLSAYSITTLGMGNFAAMVTNYAWATRAFNYPADVQQDDIVGSVKGVVEKVMKKR